jgi:uncharacterized protein YxeA
MKKMIFKITIIVIGAIAAAGLAIYQVYEEKNAENDLIKEKARADDFRKKLDETNRKSALKSDEIIQLNQAISNQATSLLSASEEARAIQDKTIKFIMGNKIPTFSFASIDFDTTQPSFTNNSDVPMYDVRIIAIDHEKMKALDKRIEGDKILYVGSELETCRENFGPLFIAPNTNLTLDYKMPEKDQFNFGFEVISRSGMVLIYGIAVNRNHKLEYIYRIYELDSNSRHILMSETLNEDLVIPENYWENNFHVDKIRRIGLVRLPE